jgi:hypothetical protein
LVSNPLICEPPTQSAKQADKDRLDAFLGFSRFVRRVKLNLAQDTHEGWNPDLWKEYFNEPITLVLSGENENWLDFRMNFISRIGEGIFDRFGRASGCS